MACCRPPKPEQHKIIERDIKNGAKIYERKVYLLLLGAGDSGKSTIFKQMKIIHLETWTLEERMEYIPIVYMNVVLPMRTLVKKCAEFEYPYELEENESNSVDVFEGELGSLAPIVTERNKHIIEDLWKDTAIQKTYQRSNEYQLNDSAPYFFQNLNRISSENYIPSENDILRARVTTTGINEMDFELEDTLFHIVDVGGQKSQRRKW